MAHINNGFTSLNKLLIFLFDSESLCHSLGFNKILVSFPQNFHFLGFRFTFQLQNFISYLENVTFTFVVKMLIIAYVLEIIFFLSFSLFPGVSINVPHFALAAFRVPVVDDPERRRRRTSIVEIKFRPGKNLYLRVVTSLDQFFFHGRSWSAGQI
jgi:hypothetical protein